MDGKTIEDHITSYGRWTVSHERVFEFDGKFYLTHYSVGATEYQDKSPYDHEESEIECVEVVPVQAFVTIYRPINP